MTAAIDASGLPADQHAQVVVASEGGQQAGFNLQRLIRVVRRRRWVFVSTALAVTLVSAGNVIYKRLFSPVYSGAFSLLIIDPVSPSNSQGSEAGGRGAGIGAVALNVTRQHVPTLIQVLQSPVVLNPVFQKLQQQWPNEKLPSIFVAQGGLQGGTQGLSQATGVLQVQASGQDRVMLQQALKFTETAYLDWSLKQRRERLQEAVRFLDEQAPDLKAKVDSIEARVEAFRLKHRLLKPEVEAEATRSQVEDLRSELISQKAELERLERLRNQVAAGKLVTRSFSSESNDAGNQNSGGGTSVVLTVPDQALLEELASLDEQIADLRGRYVANSPILQQLQLARASLIPQIQQKQLTAIGAALTQYRSSIRSTEAQIAQLEARFNNQPSLLREYSVLDQQLTIAQGNLASYLNAREQFQLEIAQNTAPWKVIAEPSVSGVPVEPKLGRGLLQGLMLGVAAGVGMALLRDRFDHVFHSPGEVRDELSTTTLLGHIPYISSFEGVRREKRFILESLDQGSDGISNYQRFHYQEAFRNLATSLRFLNSDQPLKSIALTSSIPSEGKSLMVVLLAKTMSELGQRVLLVDADLRKPQLHHRLGMNNVKGLSNLLIDEGSDWRSVLQPVANYEGWDVITAGRRPPDPPRLFSSRRMSELVQDIAASGHYDLIIYDTPPALGLADAALVAEQLDGLVMLVSLNRVDRGLPSQAIQRIREAGAPVLGVVTNARLARQESSHGYGYGYGYADYAHDPAVAYSYYQQTSEEEKVSSSKKRCRGWLASLNPSALQKSIRTWFQ